uniref:Uncharacterized protein n=1 Tax=Oryza punctata TaxID=4537 RepID=A0A0E0MCE0_ORYPU
MSRDGELAERGLVSICFAHPVSARPIRLPTDGGVQVWDQGCEVDLVDPRQPWSVISQMPQREGLTSSFIKELLNDLRKVVCNLRREKEELLLAIQDGRLKASELDVTRQ